MNPEALGHHTQATLVTPRAVKMSWMWRQEAMNWAGDWEIASVAVAVHLPEVAEEDGLLQGPLIPSARAVM